MYLKNKDYLNFIAYLQIFGIILVVLGHSFHEFPDGHHGSTFILYRLIYSFHMPLFLFISGFLLLFTIEINQSKRPIHKFIISKLKRLMLPMAVLTAVTFIPRSFMSFAADDTLTFSANNLLHSFIDSDYYPIPYFWYIHVSFILLCGCFILLNICSRLGIPNLITIISIFLILLFYALSSLPATSLFSIIELKRLGFFFALGGIYGVLFTKIDDAIPWTDIRFFMSFALAWAISFFFLSNTGLLYLCAFFGIIMSVSLAKIIEKNDWNFLDHLKGSTFILFLLSWYGNVFFQQVLSYFVSLPWWVHTLLSLISGIYIPWLAYKYLERHQNSKWIRFTSTILGQSFKNKTRISA